MPYPMIEIHVVLEIWLMRSNCLPSKMKNLKEEAKDKNTPA